MQDHVHSNCINLRTELLLLFFYKLNTEIFAFFFLSQWICKTNLLNFLCYLKKVKYGLEEPKLGNYLMNNVK